MALRRTSIQHAAQVLTRCWIVPLDVCMCALCVCVQRVASSLSARVAPVQQQTRNFNIHEYQSVVSHARERGGKEMQ